MSGADDAPLVEGDLELLEPAEDPRTGGQIIRRPLAVCAGLMTVVACAALVVVAPAKFGMLQGNGMKVYNIMDTAQLWVTRDLHQVELASYDPALSMDDNIQAAWDSFLQATHIAQELSSAEQAEFEHRFKMHMQYEFKHLSDVPAEWATVAARTLDDQKPALTGQYVIAFEAEGHSFTIEAGLGHEQISALDLVHRLGLKDDDDHANARRLMPEESDRILRHLQSVPDVFDSAEQWPHCAVHINKILNQGQCGSCWVFGGLHPLDSRICIATNGAHQKQLSRGSVTTCAVPLYKGSGDGCQGGHVHFIENMLQEFGIPTGGPDGCVPYWFQNGDGTQHFIQQDSAPMCPSECKNENHHRSLEDDSFVMPEVRYSWVYNSDPQMKDVAKAAIYSEGPIPATVEAVGSFIGYTSGVYDGTCSSLNHLVSLIGWGTSIREHFTIMNSWGEWGEGRSGKMRLIPEALCSVHPMTSVDPNGAGLKIDGSAPASTTSSKPADGGCADDPKDWADVDGDGCAKWEAKGWCEQYSTEYPDANGVFAHDACCACGGGSTSKHGGEEGTGTTDGKRCIFPFVYAGKYYHACTDVHHHTLWCATEVSGNEPYMWDWGVCAPSTNAALTVLEGPCVVTPDGCAVREWYDNNEFCRISVEPGTTIWAARFQTEGGYDYLEVNGHKFSGNVCNNYFGGSVGGDIIWSSDGCVSDMPGWEICPDKP